MSVYLKCCREYHKWDVSSGSSLFYKMADTPSLLLFRRSNDVDDIINGTTTLVTFTDMNSTSELNEGYIPKGYSVPHIILTSILLSIIMLVIVFGNLLVVIAIFTDKTLKTTQNWFIASLAVADFLLGLVIMPFSLANEMMGYWIFGKVWCDLWKAIDVLLCTASILSICLISLDRYWSITRAITYPRSRTPKKAALMITAVWFLSAVICVPPLIGWKNPLPVTEYPLCLLSDDIGYVLYSTMGSFYVPCVIMVFVYFKIFRAARRLARKNIRKNKRKQMSHDIKDEINTHFNSHDTESVARTTPESDRKRVMKKPSLESLKEKESYISTAGQNNIVRSPNECDNSIKEHENKKINVDQSVELKHESKQLDSTSSELTRNDSSISTKSDCQTTKNNEPRRISMQKISEKFSKKRHRTNGNKSSKGWRAASVRDHERHKRKIAKARERRATIVLGLVMAAFILCWCPFFTLYIITSFCYCVGSIVFTVAFFAGYCNSALNPIIYTVFNREFRHAFHRIICKNSLRCR
ncbi:alpha-2C adrenergic receptor-like [Ruditapes philippinarum]|uniref:alpha-2C adrenergic receptor-like n=1 Tax=Ruditapes philippinarum TaxID=129788 RepID=UPI00295BBDA4|nr:alpha-2C adrenergic receptor-like [Ruditapes philippinarum]